jgi:hypothetical protein
MVCATPGLSTAQTFEAVGIRAQGMAGAFVALADDGSATWWNPAGLASGALFSGIVERGTWNAPSGPSTIGVSFAVPSLGLSYYRLTTGALVRAPVVSQSDPGSGSWTTSVVNEFGTTVGQSLGNHMVLASTARLVWADEVRGDLDLGTMFRFGMTRVGFVVKHLFEPDVTSDGSHVPFDRQVRVGAAYTPRPGPVTLNAAIDADLTATPTAFGSARHLAGGGELWLERTVALRAGVSMNTIDERRTSFSVGASVGIKKMYYVDAQLTQGDDPVKEGWGLGVRVTF